MKEYMVQGLGGVLHPDHPSLQVWLNEQAAEGWRLIAVSENVGYFERDNEPTTRRHGRREA